MNARGLNRPIAAPSADGGTNSAANRAAEVARLHASDPPRQGTQVFGVAPGNYLLDDLFQETAKGSGRGARSRRLLNRSKGGIIVHDSH